MFLCFITGHSFVGISSIKNNDIMDTMSRFNISYNYLLKKYGHHLVFLTMRKSYLKNFGKGDKVNYVKAYIYMNWCTYLKNLSTIASSDVHHNHMVPLRQNSVSTAPA